MNGYNNEENRPNAGKGGRILFGIFMVLVYLAVGLLFIFDIFQIGNQTIGYIVGGILIVYGIWRGYRLYRGGY